MDKIMERIIKRRQLRERRRRRRKRFAAAAAASAVLTAALMGAANDKAGKEVVIKEINALSGFENSTTVKTRQDTAAGLLAECGLELGENDILSVSPDAALYDSANIVITRAGTVTITTADGSSEANVTKGTVGEAVAEAGYTVDENDRLVPEADTAVTDGMQIRIIRIDTATETQTAPIDFGVTYVDDPTMMQGEEKVTSEGSAGEKTLIYSVETKDGKESSRTLVEEQITKEPSDKVIARGTATPTPKPTEAPAKKQSSSAKVSVDTAAGTINGISYSKKITVTATAYSTSPSENGGYSTTAMGTPLRKGVIAVDPSVIPLGTKVYVAAPDGSWSYGTAVAQDTGGAVKGNKIDLCYTSSSEVHSFGRRSAVVYILED